MSNDKTPRLEPLTPDRLDDAQRAIYDAVRESPRAQGTLARLLFREDGSLSGPFDAFLRTPIVGLHLERLGNAFRSETTYPVQAREVAILVVGRAWAADFEWWAHEKMARSAGVPDAIIEAIAADRRPDFSSASNEERPAIEVAHGVATQLVHARRLDGPIFEQARDVLGERGTIELVLLVGFYQLISGLLESVHPAAPSPDLPVVGPPPLPGRAGIDLYAAASTTRAVRRLRPDPIPEETLARVVEAASWAPSGGNREPWRLILVRDPMLKARLQPLYEEVWSAYSANARELAKALLEERRRALERTLDAGDQLAANLAQTPVLAVFCFDPAAVMPTDADQDHPSVVGGASLYPAVQNLLLACRAEGLGCTLTTLLALRTKEVREILDIPAPWGVHAVVPIGWPERGGHGPLRRRPIQETVFRDRFGAT